VISIDPTEARSTAKYRTRLPDSVVASAVQVPGLEATTGADIIVSAQSLPPDLSSPLSVPIRRMFERITKFAYFEQRKSGSDLLSSIEDLARIQARMWEWAAPGGCGLLVTGLEVLYDGTKYPLALMRSICPDPSEMPGVIVADGRKSGWKACDVAAALMAWERRRGGHVTLLQDDSAIPNYLNALEMQVRKCEQEPIRFTHSSYLVDWAPLQATLPHTVEDWATTGSAFPRGWGEAKRHALWKAAYKQDKKATLRKAFELLLDEKVKVPGIGPKLTESLAQWVGWTKETSK